MRNVKLMLAYEGTDFHGWQMQPGVATVQGALSDAVRIITQERIQVEGASRTDTGVHALGQVAAFRTRSQLTVLEFQRALNALLPPSIRVMAAEEVGPGFHSRWNALSKIYHYRIFRGRVLPPFEAGRALHYPWPLDEQAMMVAARLFEGQHDFSSFAASSGSNCRDEDRNPIREIYNSRVVRRKVTLTAGTHCSSISNGQLTNDTAIANPAMVPTGSGGSTTADDPANSKAGDLCDEMLYVVHGKSFLRYMVRKIVGSLLEVGRGRIMPEQILEIFAAKDRTRSGPTAPPEGLYLVSIEYPDPLAGKWLRNVAWPST
jgi:tRNA pseudouridine38-40 synthase